MDSRTKLGSLAELKVAAELLSQDYEVFVGWGGKTTCDLVAIKDSEILRVQVKGTGTQSKSGKWITQLKSVRSNRTKNVIYPFDSTLCEIVGIYIAPEDRVVILSSEELHGKSEIRIT